MEQALFIHRLHFAFTVTFHYIFPQLTMGLALLILILKTKALRTRDGFSANVSTGNAWFTILGFMGMYSLLILLFVLLVTREVHHGPEGAPSRANAATG